jgi:hypothetical protein
MREALPNTKLSRYVDRLIILLFVGVLTVRIVETYNYWGRAFIQTGVLSDNLCYRGSYEMIICSPSLPPFETYLAILGILFIVSTLARSRRTGHPMDNSRRA